MTHLFDLMTTEILKTKLYRLMHERSQRELESSCDLIWYYDTPKGLHEAFKENDEADSLIKLKYGEVKF